MYTSHIGKIFVGIYNRKTKNEFSAKEFFEKVHFPLFFDHEKLLQSPGNTPIFQLIATKKTHDSVARQKAKSDIENKVNQYLASDALLPDMSFALGYGSADDMGTTSGQITNMNLHLESEDAYASWIGAALGIGVGGGQNILLDNEDILWDIYEGWSVYRKFVNQVEGINNKIETWNGLWLHHRYSDDFNPLFPDSFQPITTNDKSVNQMARPSWVNIMIILSLKYGGSVLSAYVYQFSKTNSTIGFVRIFLPQIKRMSDVYKELFSGNAISVQELSKKYETANGFLRVCEDGTIGLTQLMPKDLKKYMPGNSKLPTQKDFDKSHITFQIYYTWIIAMVNNKEFLELAIHTAKVLQMYVSGGQKSTKTRTNEVEEIINARNIKEFVHTLTQIATQEENLAKDINKTVDAVHLDIPRDNLQYFITLVRFKYALPETLLN